MRYSIAMLAAIATAGLAAQPALAETDSAGLFKKKCSICHKLDKKAMGPAIVDMNKDPAVLKSVITDGSKAMPSFSKQLDADQIDGLVTYIQDRQAASQ